MPEWKPYVLASQSPAEFTGKAIVLGILFGLLFGASTVYLGLRAGLTVSASIQIAVLAISILKKFGGSIILENNIVQTIGSAGESVAGGVVFTLPALIFLVPFGPAYFNYLQITMLTLAGGILGVLMMVPLSRALIVKEHGVLPYPEGTACAEVLVAGERGGQLAALVFGGLAIGGIWKALSWMIIGVMTSGLIIGLTTLSMHQVFGIGSEAVPAPQATLMSTIITGLLNQNLPWGLVLVGIFIAVTLELCGVHSLSFAVGLYLPIRDNGPHLRGWHGFGGGSNEGAA